MRSARLRTLLGLKSNSQNNSALNLLANSQHQPHAPNDPFDVNDPLANLINGNKQLLQLSTDLNNKRNNNITSGLNVNEVQKMLQMNETDAQSMLMMTNLDFMNQKNGKNGPKGKMNGENEDEDMNEADDLTEPQSKVDFKFFHFIFPYLI